MKFVHLDDFGLPHIAFYEDGTMIDEWRNIQLYKSADGRYYITDYFGDKKPSKLFYSQLYRYYFINPFKQKYVPFYIDLGRFGFPHYYLFLDGKVWSDYTMSYKTVYLQKGYPVCQCIGADGDDHLVSIHRMLALALIPNPKPGIYDQINHIDGNPANFSLSNLEWCDNTENQRHAARTGLHHRSISNEDAHTICKRLCNGESISDIARDMNIDHDKVRHISEGGYHDISKLYPLPNRKPWRTGAISQ